MGDCRAVMRTSDSRFAVAEDERLHLSQSQFPGVCNWSELRATRRILQLRPYGAHGHADCHGLRRVELRVAYDDSGFLGHEELLSRESDYSCACSMFCAVMTPPWIPVT